MSDLSAETGAIHGYGAVADVMAIGLAAAGTETAAAGPALLGPALGLIGGEFVAAFAAAHATHLATIAELTGVVATMGTAAVSTAAGYVGVDSATAAGLGSTDVNARV
ncbi:type VII secretion target [Antrihabitans sp. NCIMB 15449]|uniref:Excreted virulence factor EspC, type VII ESX diderm n=2 Tax=Antrihabitans TaxID=2799491 RepID=A0A934NNK6_9NOCA|nr:type VII secretion target [Antrihabitans stalagmiti]MBJ8338472.1 hypothetical protein [Antrihabitans stalagmiti]